MIGEKNKLEKLKELLASKSGADYEDTQDGLTKFMIDLMVDAYDLAKAEAHPILDNTLFQDNVSEALYEVIEDGGREFNMLVCEAKDKDGEFYQLHIRAIRMDHADHILNDEEMPMFGINNEHRLVPLTQ